MRLDAVIFGGGATGLWLLDRLSRDGHHVVLLEARSLGAGQTIGSQAILRRSRSSTSLSGLANRVLIVPHGLPSLWRDALLGRITPNLTHTRLRADCCHQWYVESAGLRVASPDNPLRPRFDAETLPPEERPSALADVSGPVVRLPEQVLCPASFIADLAAQYHDRLLKIDAERGLKFHLNSPGEVDAIQLASPFDGQTLELRPRQVIFAADADNARLRRAVGLSEPMQSPRPLHRVLARGRLPLLNGHCVESGRTIVTVISDVDANERTVWQIDGRLAEDGWKRESYQQAERVRQELTRILPGLNLTQAEWSTYELDRAECDADTGPRHDAVSVFCAGNVTTAGPTPFMLAPLVSDEITGRASSPYITTPFDPTPLANWPRPSIAPLPWNEEHRTWWTLGDQPSKDQQQPQRRAA